MIQRKSYMENISKWLGKDKIIILKGARQVGKTTIMKQIENNLIKSGEKTVFLFADDISNSYYFEKPDNFISYLNLKYGFEEIDKKLYVFIDEFQFIKQAGLFLKNIFDKYKDKLQIIVSGSSSLEITKNTEFLTGRNIEFYIDRISYKEFLSYKLNKDISFDINEIGKIEEFYNVFKNELEKYFYEYLSFGGYPEVVTSKNKEEKIHIIDSIYKNYIEKDIIHFLKIENIKAFNDLIRILANQSGNLVNKNEISNTIGISRVTLDKYLDILDGTFIYDYISPYYSNIRKELTKMSKVFCRDIGMLNYILGNTFSLENKIDIGQIVENLIYRELVNKDRFSKLYFYQTVSKAEIDFVLENLEKKLVIFEVKFRNKISKAPVIFKNFEENYGNLLDKKVIITKNNLEYKKDIDTYFIPASISSLVDF